MNEIPIPDWFWIADCTVIVLLAVHAFSKISWFFDTAWHKRTFIKEYLSPMMDLFSGFLIAGYIIGLVLCMTTSFSWSDLIYVRAIIYISCSSTYIIMGTIWGIVELNKRVGNSVISARKKIIDKRNSN